MKRTNIILIIAAVVAVVISSCSDNKPNKSVNLKSEIDSLNYAFGYVNGKILKDYHLRNDSTGEELKALLKGIKEGLKADGIDENVQVADELGSMIGNQLKTNEDFYGDSALSINIKFLRQGLINGVTSYDKSMTAEEARIYFNTTMENLQKVRMEASYGEYRSENEAFLANNAQLEGVVTTESGLQYKVEKMGKGALPTATDRVKVHYHGTLIDGTVFDSSVSRGHPAEFGVNQVIRGWVEGLQLMPVGSKFTFYIPQDLAYGPQDQGIIKPFSTLVFEVELLEILK